MAPRYRPERGHLPHFRKVTLYKGQLSNGDAATVELRWLQKTLSMTIEAIFRQARAPTSLGDGRSTANLLGKLQRRVFSKYGFAYDLHTLWSQSLIAARDHLIVVSSTLKEKLKSSRIANWKNKIKDASKSTAMGPVVYQYLRKKVQEHPANIIEEDGNIVVDPTDALRTFASKWGNIFSANLLLPRNEQVLRPVIPFIEQVRQDVSLPELTAIDFYHQVQARQLQMLPPLCFEPIVQLFRKVEDGSLQLPSILTLARQSILDKPGPDTALAKRLICVLPTVLVIYTSLRFHQLADWQATVLPVELYGGITGRKMVELTLQVKLHVDQVHTTD